MPERGGWLASRLDPMKILAATAIVAIVAGGNLIAFLAPNGPLTPMRFVSLAAAVTGVVALSIEIVRLRRHSALIGTGPRAEGEVVDLVRVSRGSGPTTRRYAVVVRFHTAEGDEITASTRNRQVYSRDDIYNAIQLVPRARGPLTTRPRVTVVYDPRRPHRILLQEPFRTGMFELCLQRGVGIFIGVVLIGTAIYTLNS